MELEVEGAVMRWARGRDLPSMLLTLGIVFHGGGGGGGHSNSNAASGPALVDLGPVWQAAIAANANGIGNGIVLPPAEIRKAYL